MRGLAGIVFAVLSFASTNTGAPAQAPSTGWTMTYSDGEGLQKLFFVNRGQVHGEVYFRCKPGEGWIFLIHEKSPNRGDATRIQSSDASVTIISRREYDEVDGTFYLDSAIPANARVMDNFAAGNALHIDGFHYPVASITEQQTIANFVKICDG